MKNVNSQVNIFTRLSQPNERNAFLGFSRGGGNIRNMIH